MSVTTSTPGAGPSSSVRDPYELDPADILEPPRGWRASWKFFGPGFVTSAAVVGSGELITATALGAEVGFLLLWLVLVSTFVKVAVQIELARWSISTGKTSITGYNDVTPKIAGRGWISYIGLLMILQIVIGQGGVLGTGALALSMVMPVGGDPFSLVSIATWVTVIAVLAVVVHLTNHYGVIEKVSTVLVALVTLGVIAMVIGLQFTPFAWTATDLAEGMQFQIQVGTMGVALAMFGMTGRGRRRDHRLQLLGGREGLRPVRGPERRVPGLGGPRPRLDLGDEEGRLPLLGHLHGLHRRVLHPRRRRAAPAGARARGQRGARGPLPHVHRRRRRLDQGHLPARCRRGPHQDDPRQRARLRPAGLEHPRDLRRLRLERTSRCATSGCAA